MLQLENGMPTHATIKDWEFKAARFKNPHCQFNMGSVFCEGWHVPKSYAKALEYYGAAAVQGHDLAMIAIGQMYLAGNGVPESYTSGIAWIKKAVRYAGTDELLWFYDPQRGQIVIASEFLKN